jgi:hypothetical protein
MLALGAVAHNHFWFYRDVIEGCLSSGDAEGVLDHVMRWKKIRAPNRYGGRRYLRHAVVRSVPCRAAAMAKPNASSCFAFEKRL